MKKLLPFIFILIFYQAVPILSMDPSSRSVYPGHQTRQTTQDKSPHSGVNPELSRGAGQDAEGKQTQAELDAIQFAKEQETKLLQARCNQAATQEQNRKIHNGLKELLKDAKIKDKPFDVNLLDKLPSDIQTTIAKMIYSHAFTHGYQLLPALIPHCQIAKRPSLERHFLSSGVFHYKISFIVNGERADNLYHLMHSTKEWQKRGQICAIPDPIVSMLQIPITLFDEKKFASCNVSGKIVNDSLYLDRGPAKTMLADCTLKQLDLLQRMWEQNRIYNSHRRLGNPEFAISLNKLDNKIYDSLPKELRHNLELNYAVARWKSIEKFNYTTLMTIAFAIILFLAEFGRIEKPYSKEGMEVIIGGYVCAFIYMMKSRASNE